MFFGNTVTFQIIIKGNSLSGVAMVIRKGKISMLHLFMYFLLLSTLFSVTTQAYTEGYTIPSLKHFEPLKSDELRHQVKRRDTDETEDSTETTHIQFKTHNRLFQLNLVPEEGLLSGNFKVVSIANGQERREPFHSRFMKGYVVGDESSHVEGHYENGLLTASISTPGDTYFVEPSWRHISDDHEFDMIVYRLSDVIRNVSFSDSDSLPRCANTGIFNSTGNEKVVDSTVVSSRQRRAVGGFDTCRVVLVADYKFFLHMGQQQVTQTVNYMISVMQRVNKIFRSTTWPSGLTEIGFEVDEVKVHRTPGDAAYNAQKGAPWDADSLLTSFSLSNWSSVCLSHLFTYQDFAKGVIGLAYVATSPSDSPGGICSKIYQEANGNLRYLNSGLSSSLNWNRRLLTAEADIVTAHELGHNFGAEHDPETSQCAPSLQQGGKYIMYTTSVSGLQNNNQKFSTCSMHAIDGVLRAKKSICFTARTGKFCGNFNVEDGEQCDPGLDAVRGNTDPCCNSQCKLRATAKCSDINSLCCDNCDYSPKTKKCREEFPLDCQAGTFCGGDSDICPNATNVVEGTECYDHGTCFGGQCVSLCSSFGQDACSCGKGPNNCKICCQSRNGTGSCLPLVNGTTYDHVDGQPCDAGDAPGLCYKAKCEKSQSNVLDQFLSLLSDFTISKFAIFMKENIVGTILVFSVLLWIPGACVVNIIDRRRDKEERDRQWWYDPKNTELMKKSRERSKKKFFHNTGGRRMPRDMGTRMYGQPTPPSRLEFTDDYIVAV